LVAGDRLSAAECYSNQALCLSTLERGKEALAASSKATEAN